MLFLNRKFNSTKKKSVYARVALRAHIDRRVTYQTVCLLENIQFMGIPAHLIHREAHEVRRGQDLSKKVCSASIRVLAQYVRHRRERTQTFQHIGYDPAQLRAIHRTIRKHAKGKMFAIIINNKKKQNVT